MRKVFLENLPKKGKLIDWGKCIGIKLDFIYDEMQGEIEIVDFILGENGKKKVIVKYNDKIYSDKPLSTDSLIKGAIGNLFTKTFEEWCIETGNIKFLELWDNEKNKISPSQVAFRSNESFYFKCEKGIHGSRKIHNLGQIINCEGRIKSLCKECDSIGQYLLDTFGEKGVDLYWSDKNTESPFKIIKNSSKKVWFVCQKETIHQDYKKSCYDFVNKTSRCPVCAGQKVQTGVNDIATTHPELVKYFKDENFPKTNSVETHKKEILKCPICGFEKVMIVSNLYRQGFSCDKCSTKRGTYPSKFIFNLLEQAKVEFCVEKRFDWSKEVNTSFDKLKGNKFYDFYVPELNLIIETHGAQHYTGAFKTMKSHHGMRGRTLEEEIENDKIKRKLALNNGIEHYIEIDCRYSNLAYIKTSVLNSRLLQVLNIDEASIDWNLCHEKGSSDKMKEACDIWESGIKESSDIAKTMKMHRKTINRYLKEGTLLGWCNYNNKKNNIKNKNKSVDSNVKP